MIVFLSMSNLDQKSLRADYYVIKWSKSLNGGDDVLLHFFFGFCCHLWHVLCEFTSDGQTKLTTCSFFVVETALILIFFLVQKGEKWWKLST